MKWDAGTLVVAEMSGRHFVGVLDEPLDVSVDAIPPKRVCMDAWGVHEGIWSVQQPFQHFNPARFAVVENDQGKIALAIAVGVERCPELPDEVRTGARAGSGRA